MGAAIPATGEAVGRAGGLARGFSPAEALIAARRLAAQQIARRAFTKPAELVAWMGAVQAQEPLAARWAVGLRLGGRGGAAGGANAIERALADGSVLRTHVLRWTWQLVTPADLHWMLPLVAPRLMARAARRHRELALDTGTFRKAKAAFTRALADGAHRTRAELGAAPRAAGVAPDGQRLPHLLGHAELQGLLCSGAPRAKQATWALLARRAPPAGAALTHDEALAELARRYFRSRGPASAADFAWWSGLAPAEARAGLAAVAAELTSESIAGVTTWRAREAPRVPAAALADAYLLPAFDEYLVAYRDRGAVLSPRDTRRINAGGGLLAPTIVIAGQVVGTWRRTLGRGVVTIALSLFGKPTPPDRARIKAAAERYGAFLGLETKIV
jgi:hypothetical protein